MTCAEFGCSWVTVIWVITNHCREYPKLRCSMSLVKWSPGGHFSWKISKFCVLHKNWQSICMAIPIMICYTGTAHQATIFQAKNGNPWPVCGKILPQTWPKIMIGNFKVPGNKWELAGQNLLSCYFALLHQILGRYMKYLNRQMKGQSEIAHLPKFANMMLIVMVIVITEILYIILIFDCFENQ